MKKEQVPALPLMDNVDNLNKEEIVELYKTMLLIRFCEQRIALRVSEKKILTPCHLYIGQEACAVGVCSVLKKTDYVFSNHRSHGHYLAKSHDINGLISEVYCRENGCSGGRGGSMHLCNPSFGLLGSTSIVGGVMGIGLGPALRAKILHTTDVSVVFHGDCVPEEGIWHESLNFAAVNKLPVLYVCENNLYAASAALEDRRCFDNIHVIAKEHGLKAYVVDGNDIFAVRHATLEALKRIRNGEGPQFIELRTYRWLGHVGPRDDIDVGLRSAEELAYWKARCPILALENFLLANNMINEEEMGKVKKEIEKKVDDAEQVAAISKKPDISTLLKNVYHEE